MPALKKHSTTRRRTNKAATAATLVHSVQDDGLAATFSAMTVVQLRVELGARGLPRRGRKADLIARLVDADDPTPKLPERETPWHPRTLEWWADIWVSPMSKEWDESDVHNAFILAALYDDIWTATTAKGRKDAAGEFRLQRKDLGLTPYDRRRLEWTIEAAEDAKASGKDRGKDHGESKGAKQPDPANDPRLALVQ